MEQTPRILLVTVLTLAVLALARRGAPVVDLPQILAHDDVQGRD